MGAGTKDHLLSRHSFTTAEHNFSDPVATFKTRNVHPAERPAKGFEPLDQTQYDFVRIRHSPIVGQQDRLGDLVGELRFQCADRLRFQKLVVETKPAQHLDAFLVGPKLLFVRIKRKAPSSREVISHANLCHQGLCIRQRPFAERSTGGFYALYDRGSAGREKACKPGDQPRHVGRADADRAFGINQPSGYLLAG